MTKRHFELLAFYIRGILDTHARLQAAVAVASASAEANRLFDADRFFEACGVVYE